MSKAGPNGPNVFILVTQSLRKPTELHHKPMVYYYANHKLRDVFFFQHCTTFQLLIFTRKHKPFHSLNKTGIYVLKNCILVNF